MSDGTVIQKVMFFTLELVYNRQNPPAYIRTGVLTMDTFVPKWPFFVITEVKRVLTDLNLFFTHPGFDLTRHKTAHLSHVMNKI